MTHAQHCDGPTCTEWTSSADKSTFFYQISRVLTSFHFCSWACLVEFVELSNLENGPKELVR